MRTKITKKRTVNPMSIYTCPNCGKKAFGPATKAMAGRMNSKGKPCQNCGKLCVNGQGATIFNFIFSTIGIIAMFTIFLIAPKFEFLSYYEVPIQFGIVIGLIVIPRIIFAFCFKLHPSIRIEPMS